MKKVTYKLSNLFSLRKYGHNNMCSESYEYPMVATVRSAIISAIIRVDGVKKAEELFNKVKNEIIYIQYPEQFEKNVNRLHLVSNSAWRPATKRGEDKVSVGQREFVDVDNITFYIGNNIPFIDMYLKNIDWIGTTESLVYLDNIEETNKLEDVLMTWDEKEDEFIYEMYDWDKKTKFENIYMYGDKYTKRKFSKTICYVTNKEI